MPKTIAAFGRGFESSVNIVKDPGKGLFILFGIGGNSVTYIAPDGTFILGDQVEEIIPKVVSKVKISKRCLALSLQRR